MTPCAFKGLDSGTSKALDTLLLLALHILALVFGAADVEHWVVTGSANASLAYYYFVDIQMYFYQIIIKNKIQLKI